MSLRFVREDVIIVDGVSTIDESMLTGESAPVGKAPGAQLITGEQQPASPARTGRCGKARLPGVRICRLRAPTFGFCAGTSSVP